jgi:Membrane bound beta barrel domain (DUF5777)
MFTTMKETSVIRSSIRVVAVLSLLLAGAPAVFAQDDAELKLAEQDFTLVALPTALRLPKFGSAFRVTHRFLRPLGEGDFGDLLADFFGLDSGAQIGLEYRFGIIKNGQIGIHRTSDKTIEFFGQYGLLRQEQFPVDISILASIDGTNNFHSNDEVEASYSPSLGVILSRTFSDRFAFYVEPIWVNNSNSQPKELADDNDTFMVGLAARIRIRPTVYLVGEITPRVAGFKPDTNQGSFAIEKRAGGHTFQLNFSNGIGTTRSQVARGAFNSDDWYLGFNISRKFY